MGRKFFVFQKGSPALKRNVSETTQKLYAGELQNIMWPIATLESKKAALVGLFQNPNLGEVNVRPS